jgi:ubiquinone/menaquinone biosynthesis C-methylase UbiE
MAHDDATHRHFIPAASFDFLLPLYDPLVNLIGRNEQTRGELVRRGRIEPGHQVLDLGCGTGSLSVLIQQRHPEAKLTGLDPDPKALARATAKAAHAGLTIRFEQGFGDALPFADASLDRVLSSLVLHHLTREEKLATFRDVRRALRPGGELHVLDFGPPRGRLDRVLMHLIHHGDRMNDNVAGNLPALMQEAGLVEARESASVRTAFGRLSILEAKRG